MHKYNLTDTKHVSIDLCETCIMGKKTAHSYSKSKYSAFKLLKCVHVDLCGPSQVSTIGGGNYFLSIVDHFTIKVWVFLLKTKNEAFEKFKYWKSVVENQTEFQLKCLTTENGMEFVAGNLICLVQKMASKAGHCTC